MLDYQNFSFKVHSTKSGGRAIFYMDEVTNKSAYFLILSGISLKLNTMLHIQLNFINPVLSTKHTSSITRVLLINRSISIGRVSSKIAFSAAR